MSTGTTGGYRRRLSATWAALLVLLPGLASAAPEATEQQRIDRLLQAVAADERSRFVRSGTAYVGKDAARFLAAKLQSRGRQVRTAEDFIEQVASRSSTTGDAYRVCSADLRCVDAGPHLRALLQQVAPRP